MSCSKASENLLEDSGATATEHDSATAEDPGSTVNGCVNVASINLVWRLFWSQSACSTTSPWAAEIRSKTDAGLESEIRVVFLTSFISEIGRGVGLAQPRGE